MAGEWAPELRVDETGSGCRLTLVGMTYGNGHTLQDAADDLICRLLNLALSMRSSGLQMPAGTRLADRRTLAYIWDLGERAARGEDIRDHVLGHQGSPDLAN